MSTDAEARAAAASLADGRVTDALYDENSRTPAHRENTIKAKVWDAELRREDAGYHHTGKEG